MPRNKPAIAKNAASMGASVAPFDVHGTVIDVTVDEVGFVHQHLRSDIEAIFEDASLIRGTRKQVWDAE